MKDHLTKPDEKLRSFSLSNESFIINGVKQNPEIHQRYKERYIHEPADKIGYETKTVRPSKPH